MSVRDKGAIQHLDTANKRLDKGAVEASSAVADTTAPTLFTAVVDTTGNNLTLNFNEVVTGHSGFLLHAATGETLTYVSGEGTNALNFTVSNRIVSGDVLSLDYTPGTVQDSSANALASFSSTPVTNNSSYAPDVTAPTLSSGTISTDGDTLTLVFSEAVTGATGFTLTPSGGAASLTYASGSGTNTLTYNLGRVINSTETVTLDYSPGDYEDLSGNALAAISARSVTNNSAVVPDVTAPTQVSTSINSSGTVVTRTFSEAVTGSTGFSLQASGGAVVLTLQGGDGTSSITWTTDRPIQYNESLSDAYSPGDYEDLSGNALAAVASHLINNNSTVGSPGGGGSGTSSIFRSSLFRSGV